MHYVCNFCLLTNHFYFACAPPGYLYLERARTRSGVQASIMSVNHGGVFLLYRNDLHAQLINTAQYQTFEHIAVYMHGAGLKSLFVVIYRRGSVPPSSSFFDEYAELLERITNYSSVVGQGRRSLWDRGDTSPQYLDWGDIITNVPPIFLG